ncbi:hypothetical protein HDU96_003519 [Phlyctochytrium bullatum]|nr:hypothetical protein HDU96_003519 [Phlyctochytrium bullatum]
MKSLTRLPAELIQRFLTACDEFRTSITVELFLASYSKPFWIRICNDNDSVRDAINPLLPSQWSHLGPGDFPISMLQASNMVLLRWDDVATIPAYVVAWVAHLAPTLLSFNFVSAAASAGRLDLIQLLHAFKIPKFYTGTMDAAAETGRLAVVRYLHKVRKEGCTAEAMRLAIENRHLDVARFLSENRTELCTSFALYAAVSNGDLDAVRFLQNFVNCEPDENITQAVPDLKTLKVLHEELGWPISSKFMQFYLRKGADVLRYCLENSPDLNLNLVMLREVCYGSHGVDAMMVVNDILPNEESLWSSNIWDLVATGGHLQALKWLYETRTEGCTPTAATKAAQRGHLDVVKYLRTKDIEPDSSTLLLAASSGNVELIRYLRSCESLHDCWGSALTQEAATSGHLDMVKYLWEELGYIPETLVFMPYTRGHVDVTIYAMEQGITFPDSHLSIALVSAARCCSIETVKRLHPLVPPIPDADLYEHPADSGNLEVIQFLHANRLERPTTRALLLAARKGRTDVARYLVKVMGMEPTAQIVGDAAYYGHTELMRFLLDRLPSHAVLDEAIELACMVDRFEELLWLHRKRRGTGAYRNALLFARSLDVVKKMIELYGKQLHEDSIAAVAFSSAFGTAKWVLESEVGRDLKVEFYNLLNCESPDLVVYVIENNRYLIPNLESRMIFRGDGKDRLYFYDDLGDPSQPSFLNLAARLADSMIFARLFAQYPQQCTTRTAELAAAAGFLGNVRFLSKNAPHMMESPGASGVGYKATAGEKGRTGNRD